MLYFASTSSDLDDLQAHPGVGVMTGPRCGGLGSIKGLQRPWASDCDALSKDGYSDDAYIAHLERLAGLHATCRFVVVPDMPGDGEGTLASFYAYAPLFAPLGFPLAYCLQDGAETQELPRCDVAFLGGTDDWREAHGAWLLERARDEGLRTHVGRVNSARRVVHLSFCHADSCDGTYVAFSGVERGIRTIGSWLTAAARPKLFEAGDIPAMQLSVDRVRSLRGARRQSARTRGTQGQAPEMPGLWTPGNLVFPEPVVLTEPLPWPADAAS